jgi:hypothetical protein
VASIEIVRPTMLAPGIGIGDATIAIASEAVPVTLLNQDGSTAART